MRCTALLAGAVLATTAAACSSGIRVNTVVAPGADLSGLHTFYVLTAPARRPDAPQLPQDDPMLDNSITNRGLRSDLGQAFQARGYGSADRDQADFVVAYYAGTKDKFETTYWGPEWDPAWSYRYWGRPGLAWPWYAGPVPANVQITEHTEGQVVIDVIDAHTRQLVWRGQGVAAVSNNPEKYRAELNEAATKIVAKFPHAMAVASSGRAP